MDIGFTQEQELQRTSARRFLENECPTTFVRQRMGEPAAVTDDFWRKLTNAKVSLAWTEPSARWDAAGLAVTPLPTIDETRKLCEVRIDNVAVSAEALLGDKHGGWPPLARVLDRATVAVC